VFVNLFIQTAFIKQTIRAFLGGMIERDYGHIVGVSSLTAIATLPLMVCYSTTKSGVRGLYSALYDELCMFEKDKSIRVSTLYPGFVNTQMKLSEVIGSNMPKIEPDAAAKIFVRGIRLNKRSIFAPWYSKNTATLK